MVWSDRWRTPQGGPLSSLLSNLVLDDLDKELAQRAHRFCRYADDCNIYVRSFRAGARVMTSVIRFLTQKLRLKVNEAKARWRARRSASSWDSASRTTEASGASRQRPSMHSRRGFGTSPAGHAGSV
ncbi:reverse transcriptase domain-containing protein [Bradyrhizobium erythrophlei]|uniref:reverse transcriptase domain-containing protein n=1 Tax=Bradyrhizobium erythrophlei TaxID=1437360 RepID=UPI0035E9B7B1